MGRLDQVGLRIELRKKATIKREWCPMSHIINFQTKNKILFFYCFLLCVLIRTKENH